MADITKYLDGLNYTITAEEKPLMDIFAESWEYCKGRVCDGCEYSGEGNKYIKPLLCMSYQYAKRIIAAGYRNVTPPAVAPVVHGRWIRFKESDPETGYIHMRCSVCSAYWSDPSHADHFRYCPNCGAKMEG